jgi:hypothetical protein
MVTVATPKYFSLCIRYTRTPAVRVISGLLTAGDVILNTVLWMNMFLPDMPSVKLVTIMGMHGGILFHIIPIVAIVRIMIHGIVTWLGAIDNGSDWVSM